MQQPLPDQGQEDDCFIEAYNSLNANELCSLTLLLNRALVRKVRTYAEYGK